MLTRDPFFSEFDRLTQEVLGSAVPSYGAPMDVLRGTDAVVLRVDLPGAASDSIEVTVDNDVLTLSATRPDDLPEGVNVLLRERPHGTVTRQVRLPDSFDRESIEASYHDGVLTVRIPLAERAKPRRIDIRRAGAPAQESIATHDSVEHEPISQ
jgi:HSP20 family protein